MKEVLFEEIKRIQEIMGGGPNLISEAAGGPGPIARFFEKLGVRSEDDFNELRRRVLNGSAEEEEIYAFRAVDDVMYNTQRTFDEVIEQNADEVYDILMKNDNFLQLGKKVWMDLNPTFGKVYNQVEVIPNIDKFTPGNLTKWKSSTMETIDSLDLPDFIKKDLNNAIEDKYRRELPAVQKRLSDLLNSIKSEVNELKNYIETTPNYFKLNKAQKEEFQSKFERAKKLLDDLSVDDEQVEQKLKTLVKQFNAAEPSFVAKVGDFLGQKWNKLSTLKKAAVVAIICFTDLLPGLSYGCGWLTQTIFGSFGTEGFKEGRKSAEGDEKTDGKTETETEKTTEESFETWIGKKTSEGGGGGYSKEDYSNKTDNNDGSVTVTIGDKNYTAQKGNDGKWSWL